MGKRQKIKKRIRDKKQILLLTIYINLVLIKTFIHMYIHILVSNINTKLVKRQINQTLRFYVVSIKAT